MSLTSKQEFGDRGEALVAEWLQQQGWAIVARQWHCRWGELDLVAHHPRPELGIAFVEVKTRRRLGLDQGGRLAITPQKQQKLWRAAQQFLLEHTEYATLPCRFDVALVVQSQPPTATNATLGEQPALSLGEYIENAFQVID